jgi:uncharacterized membrane protein YphA (DoxX/SURF4 family)
MEAGENAHNIRRSQMASNTGKSNLGGAVIASWSEQLIHTRPEGRVSPHRPSRVSRRINIALWTVQVLLALLFLFAGSTKLLLSIETLTAMGSPNQIALPAWFIRFIGIAEVLGAAGLILPRLTGIRPRLTAWAAAGLVIIMIGATAITIASGDVGPAIVPLVVGILSSAVAYGRRN